MVSGAAVDTTAAASNAAASNVADTASAAAPVDTTGAATGAPATEAPYTPKISEAQLTSAPRAKVYTQCNQPGQIALTCKFFFNINEKKKRNRREEIIKIYNNK